MLNFEALKPGVKRGPVIRITERKLVCHQFMSINHTVTIGTMLNFNGGNNRHRLKDVACKQTFMTHFYSTRKQSSYPAPSRIHYSIMTLTHTVIYNGKPHGMIPRSCVISFIKFI